MDSRPNQSIDIYWYMPMTSIPVRYGHPLQCTHQQFCCEGNGRWLLGQVLEDRHMHSWFMIYVDGLIRLRMVKLSPTKTHRNLRNHTHFGWISRTNARIQYAYIRHCLRCKRSTGDKQQPLCSWCPRVWRSKPWDSNFRCSIKPARQMHRYER